MPRYSLFTDLRFLVAGLVLVSETSSPADGQVISFTEDVKIQPLDAGSLEGFGRAVSISGNTAAISSPNASRSVYVFVGSGASWSEQDELTASDGVSGAAFGSSVAFRDETLVVGAPLDDAAGVNSGSAYIFVRAGASWSQQAKLVGLDTEADDRLGESVAISGNTAVVGAWGDDDAGSRTGAAYVFVREGEAWTQQAKLMASDAAGGDQFGWTVTIDEDTIAVGAYLDTDVANGSGAVYVFVRDGTTWSEQAKLTASDAEDADFLGRFSSLSGDTLLVSAWGDDDPLAGADAGSAYVFVRDGTSWSEQAKLTASDAAAQDYFGWGVSLSGDTAVIGAYSDDDSGSRSGSAYVFGRVGVSWIQTAKLTASDADVDDLFSQNAVSISGNSVMIGASQNDDLGVNTGSAYAFDLNNRSCFGIVCPCGNDDVLGGCRNSTGRGGKLFAAHSSSISEDDLVLQASDLPPGNLALFFAADSVLGLPVQVGDGMLCIGGSSCRYIPLFTGIDGSMTQAQVVSSTPPGFFVSGEPRYFQAWSRDVFCMPIPLPCPSPCGGGSTVTNAVEVLFYP